jgi:acyl-CoA thioesterase-1
MQPARAGRRWPAAALALAAALWAAAPAAAEEVTIVAFGDSIIAGYGLLADAALPARLEAALRERGHDVAVVNAGVSGDTTAAALERLDWAVGADADAVIVELGGNDALRGIDPGQTRANLDAILARLTERGLPVLLAGMLAPRNLGPDYARAFDAVFPDLAARHRVAFYPFLLEGVATLAELNQDDGIHPNEKGVARIVAGMLPAIETLVAAAKSAMADPELN